MNNRKDVPGLGGCGKDFNSLIDCIIKSCMTLIYYHLSNPESEITEKQKKIAQAVISGVESALNETCLISGEQPKTMNEVLLNYLDKFNPDAISQIEQI